MSNFADSIELVPSSPKGAALIFHGLSGNPGSVEKIAKELFAKDFYVYAPQLAGHKGNIEELKIVPHYVWLEEARKAFTKVLNKNPELPKYVLGQSFGALLALYVASNYPGKIQKCVALACPAKFRSLIRSILFYLLSLLPDCLLNRLGYVSKRYTKDLENANYSKHSLSAVARLVKIRSLTLSRLHLIECPVMIGQDPNDYHVHSKSLDLLTKKLTRAKVSKYIFVDAGHRLFNGKKAIEVLDKIKTFIFEE
ncbi:MAG: alpha/beta fold hydrolase [Bdellovibrionales bacterium]|nr:alpha/beta fold hydrolase [Bdellovibrionales bacterium]